MTTAAMAKEAKEEKEEQNLWIALSCLVQNGSCRNNSSADSDIRTTDITTNTLMEPDTPPSLTYSHYLPRSRY
jgi:hypothetical protein